jgi:hypothetical protein
MCLTEHDCHAESPRHHLEEEHNDAVMYILYPDVTGNLGCPGQSMHRDVASSHLGSRDSRL